MAIKLQKKISLSMITTDVKRQIIKPRFDKWLEQHADDPFDKEIADWVRDQLIEADRDRTRSFGGSSSGFCERRQILNYLGAPQPPDRGQQLEQIFQDGTWRHLRLQAQMAQARIVPLSGLETPLDWPNMRARGTADGALIVPDDHPNKAWRGLYCGLEIKGAMSWVYKMMTDPSKYERQAHRYALMGGFDLFSFYVESKDSQESKEWVIEIDQTMLQEQRDELNRLNGFVDLHVLPPQLTPCSRSVGKAWKDCPYGGLETRPCHQATTYDSVKKLRRVVP